MTSQPTAFSLGNGEDVPFFLRFGSVNIFPSSTLHPRVIKHYIAELLSATASKHV